MMRHVKSALRLTLLVVLAVTSIWPAAAQDPPLRVVATTTILADVVRRVGEPWAQVTALLPVGTDVHAFQPTPADLARLADADLLVINGFDLEAGLQNLLTAFPGEPLIASAGITPRLFPDGSADPHVWLDPRHVEVWVANVAAALSAADPQRASLYAANAALYRRFLEALDGWILERVAQVPATHRRLVTDHDAFGYFAARYGFELVGTVILGGSSASEPSARALAELEEAIRRTGVRAVFVGQSVNPELARRLAEDTGVPLVFVYTGSLSGPEGPASTYLDYMRFNTNAVVEALR